jgi:hypothetical protein
VRQAPPLLSNLRVEFATGPAEGRPWYPEEVRGVAESLEPDMKLKDLLEMAKDNPALLEYTLTLSEYFALPDDGGEDIQVVTDFPIRGIAAHDDEKELRFVMKQSDVQCIEQSKDRILKFIEREKKKGNWDMPNDERGISCQEVIVMPACQIGCLAVFFLLLTRLVEAGASWWLFLFVILLGAPLSCWVFPVIPCFAIMGLLEFICSRILKLKNDEE